jgi:lipopolysaccharide assembly protein A
MSHEIPSGPVDEPGSYPQPDSQPVPAPAAPPSQPAPGTAPPADNTAMAPPPEATTAPPAERDPLRRSRASNFWIAVVGFGVLLVLLVIFILQNRQSVEVSYLGLNGHMPLAAAMLISVAAGLLLAAIAGSVRILQLRRRVRRLDR